MAGVARRARRNATIPLPMGRTPIVDHAIVDALHTLLDGAGDVHIVGALCEGARERLALRVGGTLSTAEHPDPSPVGHGTVVALDMRRLHEAQKSVSPGGTLTVAVFNPRHASILVEVLEGSHASCPDATDLDGVCAVLERDGWQVADATPVAVPLALTPFDPARMPKTVLAYLYARIPEIETYCFLLRARRSGAGPRWSRRPTARPPEHFPTMPWKTEMEWREEWTRWASDVGERERRARTVEVAAERANVSYGDVGPMLESLRIALTRSDEELSAIKSSLTWRAIVKYRMARERLLPPGTRRGRLYERTRSAVRRLARHGA